MLKCNLPNDINDCQYCDLKDMKCNNPSSKCSFKEEYNIKNRFIKKEKWYENTIESNSISIKLCK